MSDAIRKAIADIVWNARAYPGNHTPEQVADRIMQKIAGARESLRTGHDHLTVSGKFQSDKYPWCPAGYLPLKIGDPMATDLLLSYANRRATVDTEFARDLREAIAMTKRKEADHG
jgi:hypothetical protein